MGPSKGLGAREPGPRGPGPKWGSVLRGGQGQDGARAKRGAWPKGACQRLDEYMSPIGFGAVNGWAILNWYRRAQRWRGLAAAGGGVQIFTFLTIVLFISISWQQPV